MSIDKNLQQAQKGQGKRLTGRNCKVQPEHHERHRYKRNQTDTPERQGKDLQGNLPQQARAPIRVPLFCHKP